MLLGDIFRAVWPQQLIGSLLGDISATYKVAPGEHISVGLAGATYMVPLVRHFSGGLAGAAYRVALG